MKASAVLIVALLVAMVLPVQAQEAEAGRIAFEDDAGDVEADVAGTSLGNPGGHYDHLDLVSAVMVEAPETFTVTLGVAALPDPSTPDTEGGTLRLGFHYVDMRYRVDISYCTVCYPGGVWWANLYASPDEADNWTQRAFANYMDDALTEDRDADTLSFTFDRELILDQNGAPAFPGRSLDRFWARSVHWSSGSDIYVFEQQVPQPPFNVVDEAPDDADFVDGELAILHGLRQTGHARLYSDVPYRASNGEATTFLYEITAENTGDEADIFTLTARGIPADWDVTFPVPDLALGAGESTVLPVLVSVPFAHRHGTVDTMVVEMQSAADPGSTGRLELGIRYVDPPQPAGHHDTVHLHSNVQDADPADICTYFCWFSDEAFMNTLEDDPLDTGNPVPAWNYGTGLNENGTQTRFRWELPLSPALRLGLDFDVNGTGELLFPVDVTVPIQQARLRGELVRYGPEQVQDGENGQTFFFQESTPLATFQSERVDLSGEHTFQLEMTPTPESDYIPYHPANQMVLEVVLEGTTVLGTSRNLQPVMQPGGTMTLPLLEYHDPVDDLFGSLTGPVLTIEDRAQRILNPGDVALFHVELRDAGQGAGTYRFSAAGLNAEWAAFPAGTTVTLDAGSTVTVPVQVRVPADAFDGDKADLFIQAVNAGNETQRALARVVVDVDTDAQHGDDSDVKVDVSQDAPTVSLLAVVALVGAAVAVARRR